jgi:hypothetical protein
MSDGAQAWPCGGSGRRLSQDLWRPRDNARQNGVKGRAPPVAGDEDGNIVLIGTRMTGRSAPSARLSRQIGPPGRDGFEDEGLVRLKIPLRSRLVVGGRAEKPMPPAEGGRRMDAAQLSGLGQALALDHRLGVIEATLLLAQMPHRRFAQRLERAPAALAVGTATARPSGPNQRISRLAQCGRPWLSTRSTLAVPSVLPPGRAGRLCQARLLLPKQQPLRPPSSAPETPAAAGPLMPAIGDSEPEKSSARIESPQSRRKAGKARPHRRHAKAARPRKRPFERQPNLDPQNRLIKTDAIRAKLPPEPFSSDRLHPNANRSRPVAVAARASTQPAASQDRGSLALRLSQRLRSGQRRYSVEPEGRSGSRAESSR